MNSSPSSVVAGGHVRGATWRLVAALLVVACEVALALRTLDFDHLRGADAWWAESMRLLSHNAPWAACVGAVTLLCGFGRWRAAGGELVREAPLSLESAAALALHASCGLCFAALSRLVIAGGSTIAWLHATLPFLWLANGVLLVVSAGIAAVPLERWRAALAPLWRALVLGGFVGTALFWLARFVDGNYFLWGPLADVTLAASATLLELVADEVHLEQETRILGVGSFRVIVSKYCSGLEGLALFGLFFASFMTLLRSRLRIARAVWLLPVGMVVVWSMNAVRIAALVALGAYHDPQLAVDAFHTHAGWPPLVAVALGCVALTTRVRWFAAGSAVGAASAVSPAIAPATLRERDGTAAYLVPLLGVVATGLVAGAFLEHGANSAPLRVLVGAALLWRLRGALPGRGDVRGLLASTRAALLSPAVWLFTAVALAAWIVCDTTRGAEGAPPAWLGSAHPLAAAAFWCAALASYALVTPLVEELAFRGYAQRRLVSARFEEVPLKRPAPWALLVSALAFGALHGNFVGGVLVAVVFSLAAARRGRLADAVAVHALVNAILAAVAVLTGRWGFWF
jgi:hypothetical protein